MHVNRRGHGGSTGRGHLFGSCSRQAPSPPGHATGRFAAAHGPGYDAAIVRPTLPFVLLAACGGSAPELDGTWESERDASARIAIDGDKVTMNVAGLNPTVYRQRVERTAEGYRLRWTKEGGEELHVEARLDADRLLLAFEGQDFVLRRTAR